MIIDTKAGSSVTVTGDIKEFETSIDPKNLELISLYLTSNLYSHPEQSFIREIVSNAWDSHVEAGTTDVPVIVKMDTVNQSITIRDYGTGLSPERFKEIYCNIGSSTKRDSNAYIGGFGLGRYSAIACSNTVYITSYYQGKAFQYIMVKSGNVITTNLVYEIDTTEKDGVEVSIKNITRFAEYKEALDYIIFFPNVYVEYNGYDYRKDLVLKYGNHYAVSSIKVPHTLLLGNVLYPCDASALQNSDSYHFLRWIKDTGIVIKFEVGELHITPNREAIIYDESTVKIINTRIEEANQEIKDIITQNAIQDFTDIKDYYEFVTNTAHFNLLNNAWTRDWDDLECKISDFQTVTYKGTTYSNNLSFLRGLLNNPLPFIKGILDNGTLKKTNLHYYNYKRDTIITVVLKNFTRFSSSLVEYLKSLYGSQTVLFLPEYSLQEYADELKKSNYIVTTPTEWYLCEEVYNKYYTDAIQFDAENDSNFLTFKENYKKAKVKPVVKNLLWYTISSRYGYPERTKHIARVLTDIKPSLFKYHKGIVLGPLQVSNEYLEILSLLDYQYISASEANLKLISNLHLNCFITKEEVIKSKKLSLYYTFRQSSLYKLYVSDVKSLYYLMPKTLQDKFKDIYQMKEYLESKNSLPSLYAFNELQIPINTEFDNLCKEFYLYYTKYNQIIEYLADNHLYNDILVQYYILKTKLFRLNSKRYIDNIANNPIIKLLCKK